MAPKRTAQDAFGRPNGQLSAFAAAKQARQRAEQPVARSDIQQNTTDLASTIAGAPYDGSHTGSSASETPNHVEEPFPARTPPRPSVRLSIITPGKDNIIKKTHNSLELSLKADEFVTFIGEYSLEVLKGLVSIQGAMLHPNSGPQRVYALTTQALPAVVSRKDQTVIKVTSVGSGHGDAIQNLRSLSPLFSNIGAGSKANGSFELLVDSSDDSLQRPLVPLEIDEDTRRVFSRLNARLDGNERAPRVVAVGAKSSGKSTFNRLLCNMILTRPGQQQCFYLDLDPGQPEFGPSGQISLVEVTAPILGPSFTHPASVESKDFRLVRCHTIAATSFKDDPGHYVNCVIDLAKWIQRDTPVIVNSCGWVSGLGATVLADIVASVGITDIVVLGQLDSDLEGRLQSQATMQKVARRQGRTQARPPADLRAMQTMAYFHRAKKTWNHKRISQMRPWIVRYSGPNAGIEAILSYGQAPQPEFLSEVLDGSIVAIVKHDANLFDGTNIERTPDEDVPYIISKPDGFSFPTDPQHSNCLGLALIRGIDSKNKKLHLVTPLPESQIADLMQQKVALVRGGFDSPEWAYLEDLHNAREHDAADTVDRPWVTLREPVGVEGSVWRLRHPPTRDSLR